jgi:ADP-ribosylation factor-like protein 2
VKQLLGEDVNSISPTLGFDIKTLNYQDFQLNIWDIGGQETLRSYWRNYFENTDAILWVIDTSDKDRLLDCKRELSKLITEEKLLGCPICIMCNKRDLKNSLSDKEISEIMQLQDLIVNRHYVLKSCCGITGDGLEDCIQWTMKEINQSN